MEDYKFCVVISVFGNDGYWRDVEAVYYTREEATQNIEEARAHADRITNIRLYEMTPVSGV